MAFGGAQEKRSEFRSIQVGSESSGTGRESQVLSKVCNDFVGLPNAHACLNARALRVHAEWKEPTGSVSRELPKPKRGKLGARVREWDRDGDGSPSVAIDLGV